MRPADVRRADRARRRRAAGTRSRPPRMGAAVELAFQHQPHPDSVPTETKAKVGCITPVAVLALGDRRGVHVVLDHGLCAEKMPEVAQHRRPLPPGQVRSRAEERGRPAPRSPGCRPPSAATFRCRRRLRPAGGRPPARQARAPGQRRSSDRAARLWRARTVPARSVTAPRTNSRPTSSPRTKPASLRIS